MFHEALGLAFEVYDHRPKRKRRTARALYAEIKAGGYARHYTRATDCIRSWRRSVGQRVPENGRAGLKEVCRNGVSASL